MRQQFQEIISSRQTLTIYLRFDEKVTPKIEKNHFQVKTAIILLPGKKHEGFECDYK